VRQILFDVGGVLIESTLDYEQFARLLGTVDVDALKSAVSKHRQAYDCGGTAVDFWIKVAEDSGAEAPHVSTIKALTEVECNLWTAPSPSIMGLLHELVRDGESLSILSNAPIDLAEAMRRSELGKMFVHLLFSSEINVLKPDPAAFTAAVELLKVEPETIAYFDDQMVNVMAARAAGFHAHLWKGIRTVRHCTASHLIE
jgi:putative hydrolase of the HAD superfamily